MNRADDYWKQIRRLPAAFIVTLVFMAGFALGSQTTATLAQRQFTQPDGTETLFEPLWQAYALVQREYVAPDGQATATQTLVDGAIRGMIEALGDENSGYMTPQEYPLMFDDLSGVIEGIGVVIRNNAEIGGIEVANILPGTPAERAGIKIGDIFVAVNGEDVFRATQIELAGKVRGPAGSTVTITMQRDGENFDFDLTRERIDIPNIDSRLIEDSRIGYIRLHQFTSEARSELDAAIEQFGPARLDGLILDFRGNPGGLLTSAISIASAFIEDGILLIEDFGEDREQVFRADGTFKHLRVPLVVLVDERSASASELVAGALQDMGAATIIGETTFGKGTVQTVQEMVNGGGLRLTIARWLTPDRHWIHGAGITPDIVVDWDPERYDDPDDPQLEAAVNHLQSLTYMALD